MKKIYLLVILMFIPTLLFAQIMYNIAKPPSYKAEKVRSLNNLPVINYPVDSSGDLYEQNLKINLKNYAVNEIIDNKYVSRVKVKIFTKRLGYMSINLNNLRLDNNSHCFVYTSDYKIIAGPIYRKSIYDIISIRTIPADELIIEIVSDNPNDFNIDLDEISFKSITDSKNITDNILGSTDSCHTCTEGVKSYSDFVDEPKFNEWFGVGHSGEIFNML